MRASLVRVGFLVAAFALSAAAEPALRQDCLASTTADSLLLAPSDPELFDYAACSELTTGREGLCDGFQGGPASVEKPTIQNEIVMSDGRVHQTTVYGVCVSRAAAYRFLALLVEGASQAQLRPQLSLMLYGENLSVDAVLRTYVDAYRTGSLEGLARPDLARIGFFNHVLGLEACKTVRLPGLRRECEKKAATLAAFRAKDPSLCRKADFLCRALIQGPDVCRKIGERIVRRFCERPRPKPVTLAAPPRA